MDGACSVEYRRRWGRMGPRTSLGERGRQAGILDSLAPQGLRGGLEGGGRCLRGTKLKCPAAKWLQPFCRLKCQPEVTDLDPAKSTDTQTSSWEAPHQGPHGHTGHSSRLHRRVLSPTPDRRPLAGGWTVGVVGRGCHPPSCRPQGCQELHHHPEPKRGARGLSLPSGRGEPGAWASPRRTREGTYSHTRPHVLTQVHSCLHVCSPTPTHTLPPHPHPHSDPCTHAHTHTLPAHTSHPPTCTHSHTSHARRRAGSMGLDTQPGPPQARTSAGRKHSRVCAPSSAPMSNTPPASV